MDDFRPCKSNVIIAMAPIRPKAKAGKAVKSRTNAASTGARTSSPSTPFPDNDDPFKSNKSDKRRIKHSSFVSKIEKSRKKPLKRRRPSKKLIAGLDELADALPDAGEQSGPQQGAENGSGSGIAAQVNVIKHKSLKHRPGALKRKEKLDRVERERFGKNMAQMAGGINQQEAQSQMQESGTKTTSAAQAAGADGATSARWAALRSFISQTMEHNPEFSKPT